MNDVTYPDQPNTTPPDNSTDEIPQIEHQPFSTIPSTPQPRSKNFKRNLYLTIIVVVLLLIAGIVTYVLQHNSENETPSTDSSVLLTYVNQDKSKDLIVTNAERKVLAKLTLRSDKDTFSVLANNGQEVLIGEVHWFNAPADINSIYYLVEKNGKTTELPSAVASVIRNSNGYSNSNGYLDNSDNYLYVSCSNPTCSLNSINLTTAASATISATSFTPDPNYPAPNDTMFLLGVSPDNVAYTIVEPVATNGYDGTTGTLTMINLKTKETIKTLPMTDLGFNVPVLAFDYKKLIYTSQIDESTVEIMNLVSGKITKVVSDITGGTGYDWSPDSLKAEFVVNGGTTITIAYVDIAKAQIVSLKNFGDRRFNDVTINGWSSSTLLNYTYFSTTTANDFWGVSSADYAVDISSGKVIKNPTPTGYRLIAANTFPQEK